MHIKNLFLFVLVLWTLRWTDAYVGSPIVLGKRTVIRVVNIDITAFYIIVLLILCLYLQTVPGILGSRLEGRLNDTLVSHFYCPKHSNQWITLWLSIIKILPPEVYCLSDYIK